ncbi:MAG: MoaD/ThiS family protein [Bacillota bacterium]|nr:MoaD/ThiS family protein [Bacillota bacterium]
MKIKVTVIGPLSEYFDGQKTREIYLSGEAALGNILDQAGLPREKYSFAIVNGIKVNAAYIAKENDEVVVFPLISGG